MRNKVIAGNWKMNKDIFETADLINELKKSVTAKNVEVIVCPPFTSLVVAQQLLKGSSIKLGAQDVSVHDDGAYTGEVSVTMLKSVGCEYVIVGHSERCLLYTSDAADDLLCVDLGGRRIIKKKKTIKKYG